MRTGRASESPAAALAMCLEVSSYVVMMMMMMMMKMKILKKKKKY